MPKFVFVPEAYSGWLKKAVEFAKRNEAALVGAGASTLLGQIVHFLQQNKVPHGHADSRDKIPPGSHYHQAA